MSRKVNLVIDQGTTYETSFELVDENGDPRDLTGYTARSQLRKWYTSVFATDFVTEIVPTLGKIILRLDAVTSGPGELPAGRYVYDVQLTETLTGNISRVFEGIVTVTPEVTRTDAVEPE
jgi:hypothetical protein